MDILDRYREPIEKILSEYAAIPSSYGEIQIDSQVTELERAIGQYGIYEELLKTQEPERELYWAVPIDAYENIFKRQVGKM